MRADGEAVIFCGCKNAFGFFEAEGDFVAENVDELGELLRRCARDHFFTDEIDVFLGAAREFFRDCVGSEKRGDHSSGPVRCRVTDRLKRFHFRIKRQAVTGFGFDRSCAMGSHLVQCLAYVSRELCEFRTANTLEAGANASAGAGDFFVGCALNSLFEINQTWRSEGGMRVRIDESGNHDLTGAIDFRDALTVLLDRFPNPGIAEGVSRSANRNDFSAEAENGGVFENAELFEGRPAARAWVLRKMQSEELADVGEESGAVDFQLLLECAFLIFESIEDFTAVFEVFNRNQDPAVF